MSDDFPLVQDAFADSIPGRILDAIKQLLRSAWDSSMAGGAVQSATVTARTAPAESRVATVAASIAIAAAMQPVFMALMPLTVVPAVPWPLFVLVAGFAALIALRPAAFVSAWKDSRLARRIRR